MIINRLTAENPDKEIIYFRNDFEDAVMRQVNRDKIYVKFKGKKEFAAHPDSGVVWDAVMQINIDYIDKETYDNW
jgi:hypothetical protein